MVWRIARKELLEMSRDGRFLWAFASTLALLLGALAMGWQHYVEINKQHDFAQRATREQWLQQGEKNPHAAAHYGVYAFKPKLPLSLFDRGIDPYVGVASWLEAHKQNEFKFKPAQDATALQRLGELTGATVLRLLIPLLIVLLTFSTISAEREHGTLRQLLSIGVDRLSLAWGKVLGVGLAVTLLLFPAVALSVLALTLSAGGAAFKQNWGRLLLMLVAYLLYLFVFVALSVAVSARAKSSRSALTVLLGFWIFNGLVAPKAATDLARTIHRTPSAVQFAKAIENDMESGIDGHSNWGKMLEGLKLKLMKQYKVDRVEDLPLDFNGIRLQAGEDHGNEVFDKHFNQLWETYEKQRQVHRLVGLLAPALTIQSISMGTAGTDFPQHEHFSRAAENYRRMLNREMNLDLARHGKGQAVYAAGHPLWHSVPEFKYEIPEVRWVLLNEAFSFGVLAVWTIVAIIAVRLAVDERTVT
jgi:ABC-2 type transport system permease protein